jgi:hypothetical protein
MENARASFSINLQLKNSIVFRDYFYDPFSMYSKLTNGGTYVADINAQKSYFIFSIFAKDWAVENVTFHISTLAYKIILEDIGNLLLEPKHVNSRRLLGSKRSLNCKKCFRHKPQTKQQDKIKQLSHS